MTAPWGKNTIAQVEAIRTGVEGDDFLVEGKLCGGHSETLRFLRLKSPRHATTACLGSRDVNDPIDRRRCFTGFERLPAYIGISFLASSERRIVPFGCEAVVSAKSGLYLKVVVSGFGAAVPPTAGKRRSHRFITVMRYVFHEKHRS